MVGENGVLPDLHVTEAPVISDIVADGDMPFDLHAPHKFSALLNTDEVNYTWTWSTL